MRLLTMRGTIHVLTPDDAVALRPLVQPSARPGQRGNQNSRPARGVPAATRWRGASAEACWPTGPLPVKQLGERLGARCSRACRPGALAHTARERVPLVQVPPRGLWGRSGGVVYQTVETWLGRRSTTAVDGAELVRRYLRAFGPATAVGHDDVVAGDRLGPVFARCATS